MNSSQGPEHEALAMFGFSTTKKSHFKKSSCVQSDRHNLEGGFLICPCQKKPSYGASPLDAQKQASVWAHSRRQKH